jgi:hypothetical protein
MLYLWPHAEYAGSAAQRTVDSPGVRRPGSETMSNDLKQWQWTDEDPIENLLLDPNHQDAASLPESPPSEPGEPVAPFDLGACLEELKRWQAVADSSPANVSWRNHLEECQWVDEDPFARPARAPHKTNGAHLPAVSEVPGQGLAKGPWVSLRFRIHARTASSSSTSSKPFAPLLTGR